MNKHLNTRQDEMRKRWAQSATKLGGNETKEEATFRRRLVSTTNNLTTLKNFAGRAAPSRTDRSPTLEIKFEYGVFTDISIAQERTYCESYLPLTMKIATQSEKLLITHLDRFPRAWPFEDKLLVLIAPTFHKDVRDFHRSNGPSMACIFKEHQLEHLDKDLSEHLSELLKNLSSGTVE